jgi:hypothetical protein
LLPDGSAGIAHNVPAKKFLPNTPTENNVPVKKAPDTERFPENGSWIKDIPRGIKLLWKRLLNDKGSWWKKVPDKKRFLIKRFPPNAKQDWKLFHSLSRKEKKTICPNCPNCLKDFFQILTCNSP